MIVTLSTKDKAANYAASMIGKHQATRESRGRKPYSSNRTIESFYTYLAWEVEAVNHDNGKYT